MKTIRVEELVASGFTEDPEGLRVFQRRYVRPVAIAAVGFIALLALSAIAITSGILPISLVVGALATWLAIWVAFILACRSCPRSRLSGKKLEKYRNLSPEPGYIETVYVDTESKSYFVQGFGAPGP